MKAVAFPDRIAEALTLWRSQGYTGTILLDTKDGQPFKVRRMEEVQA